MQPRVSGYRVLGWIESDLLWAESECLQEEVLLRLLPESLSRDELALHRYARALRELSALKNPHVCRVFELARAEDSRWCAVLEYHKGKSLEDRIREGPVPILDAVRWGWMLADGLGAIHSVGLLHGYLTPRDVRFGGQEQVVILNRGLAAGLDVELTRQERPGLEALYSSPEVIGGQSANPASEVFSLGLILAEMLLGRHPVSSDPVRYAERLPGLLPVQPSRHMVGISTSLDGLVLRMTEPSSGRRASSAFEAAAELRQQLSAAAGAEIVLFPRRIRPAGVLRLVALFGLLLALLFLYLGIRALL